MNLNNFKGQVNLPQGKCPSTYSRKYYLLHMQASIFKSSCDVQTRRLTYSATNKPKYISHTSNRCNDRALRKLGWVFWMNKIVMPNEM